MYRKNKIFYLTYLLLKKRVQINLLLIEFPVINSLDVIARKITLQFKSFILFVAYIPPSITTDLIE